MVIKPSPSGLLTKGNIMESLKITSVTIFPVNKPSGRLRAIARVVLNEQLQLTNLKIYEGTKGLFLAYPIEATSKGEEFRQVFYPVARGFREDMDQVVVAEYNKIMENEQ
jgi:stage V sporulation protein G